MTINCILSGIKSLTDKTHFIKDLGTNVLEENVSRRQLSLEILRAYEWNIFLPREITDFKLGREIFPHDLRKSVSIIFHLPTLVLWTCAPGTCAMWPRCMWTPPSQGHLSTLNATNVSLLCTQSPIRTGALAFLWRMHVKPRIQHADCRPWKLGLLHDQKHRFSTCPVQSRIPGTVNAIHILNRLGRNLISCLIFLSHFLLPWLFSAYF